jgi:SAM-dependent methyltransferase
MTSQVEQDIHRSIGPATRLIVAGIFVLVACGLGCVELAMPANSYFVPNKGLWFFVVVLFICAVVVFIWPPARSGNTSPNNKSLRPQSIEVTDHTYSAALSINFYQQVADIYDARLTSYYLDTLRTAAELLLQNFLLKNQEIKALDIGAGTGQFLRLLEGTKRMQWTCLEPAHAMATTLRTFFQAPPVKAIVYEVGFEDMLPFIKGQRFDVICMNSLLSSMSTLPDFGVLCDLLSNDGILLITDGHPDIRKLDQEFRMRTMDGKIHSLEVMHRSSSEVISKVTNSGLFSQHGIEQNVSKKGNLYSYALCFKKK